MPSVPLQPIRVAVVNDHEIVVRGLAAMLAPFADRVHVVELDAGVGVSQPVDIALYDAFSMPSVLDPDVEHLVVDRMVGRTVLYTWGSNLEISAVARRHGLDAVLHKELTAAELVEALERVHAGETLLEPMGDPLTDPSTGTWPGQAEGLTARESEIIVLITEGLSNSEIAARTYLSINSVKSYIRSAYRTMGVTSRSKALLWGIDHSFARDHRRIFPPSRSAAPPPTTFWGEAAGVGPV